MAAAKKPAARGIEDIIAGATLRETTVPLCMAGHLQGEFEDLERQLAEAAATVGQSLVGVDRTAIVERMGQVRAEMAEHLVEYRFRALTPRAWSDLQAEHPAPSAADLFDPATFGPAAIAACAVEPEMTVDQYHRLAERMTDAQQEALLSAVWRLNTTAVQRVPFSLLGSGIGASLTGES